MPAIARPLTATRKSLRKDKPKDDGKKRQLDDKSDEIFERNIEIVIALLSTVPFKHSDSVRKWISKLFDPTIRAPVRNAYLAYLLFQMQNMRISNPFDKAPPNALEDPGKLMAPAKWKTILQEADKELQDRFEEKISPQLMANFRTDFKTPADFLSDQPIPTNNGMVVYGGCFSNHFAQ